MYPRHHVYFTEEEHTVEKTTYFSPKINFVSLLLHSCVQNVKKQFDRTIPIGFFPDSTFSKML